MVEQEKVIDSVVLYPDEQLQMLLSPIPGSLNE
jgi:hypothetical protein